MKLLIDIPEDCYNDIIKNGFIYDEDNEVITHAIKNGRPLSDEVITEIEEIEEREQNAAEEQEWGTMEERLVAMTESEKEK